MIQPGIVLRHEPAIRHLTVASVRRLSPSFMRITLAGDGLAGFTSAGPTDHCKVFFPDPATGELSVPRLVDGAFRPPESGTVIARDYTPRRYHHGADGSSRPELDFFLHGVGGPGSAWAAAAKAGDPLVVAGPRGSRMLPTGMSRVVIATDEAALPALARWIELVPDDVDVVALASLSNESDAAYLDPAHVNRARLVWLDKRAGSLERAVRAYGPITDDTYVWAAGEATALIPIRRYLRRELGLAASRAKVDGYWKHGQAGRDHHAPIDPADLDD